MISALCFPFHNFFKCQDPKRKIHKPVKGVLRLEIEKLQASSLDIENTMESGGVTFDSVGHGDQLTDSSFSRSHGNGSDGVQFANSKSNYVDGKELARNGSIAQGNLEPAADDVCHEIILLICLQERCCSSHPFLCINW